MENGLQDTHGIIRIHSHDLRTMQCTRDISDIYGHRIWSINQGRHVVVYLDNILIYATTITELVYWTHKVFQLLLKLDLYLRPTKCSFNQTSVEYLGLIISEGELHMDPVKLKAVQDWPKPKKVKDIQQFLGFCNFYHRFVQDYSTLA